MCKGLQGALCKLSKSCVARQHHFIRDSQNITETNLLGCMSIETRAFPSFEFGRAARWSSG